MLAFNEGGGTRTFADGHGMVAIARGEVLAALRPRRAEGVDEAALALIRDGYAGDMGRSKQLTAQAVCREVIHRDRSVAMSYTVTMSDKTITITIKGKVGYEDQITVSQAARIIAFLNADEGDAPLRPDQGAGLGGTTKGDDHKTTQQEGKQVASAREALDLSGAKTNPEKIVALGRYVLQDGGETFKVEDVKTQFRRARETTPGNFSRDLATAVQAGWIAQGDGDEYYITNKIQGIFDGDFKFPKGNGGGGGRSKGTTKTSTKTKAKPEVFGGIDEFPARMEGVQPYSKMKTDKDRLLWALHFAKVRDIKGLSNKDLAWLTDHLGAGVASGNITASFRRAKSAGYMNRSTVDQTLRITDDGETYLKTASAADA